MIVTIHQHAVKGTSIDTGPDVDMLFPGEPVSDRLESEFTTHRIDVPEPWELFGEPGDYIHLFHPGREILAPWDAFLAATRGDYGFRLAGDVIEEATPCE